MKQTIHNEKTGIDYTLVGEVYLPNLVLPHSDYEIGVWGHRYLEHIKTHRKGLHCSENAVQVGRTLAGSGYAGK